MRFMKRYWLEIIMAAPLVLYILGFSLGPVLRTIYISFTNRNTGKFDFSNYTYIFEQRGFGEAFMNTISITLIGLLLQLIVALLIAIVLRKAFRGRSIFRTIMLIPMGVPTLVSGVTMLYIFSTNGYLNELLYRLQLIDNPIIWNDGGFKTIMMIVIADMWKVLPIMILLLLAGLESIEGDVYEASSIDGATKWRNFIHITLPLLKPTITMALILRAIDAFRIFELPLVLAGRNTPVLATYAFSEYRNYGNSHSSGAAATILLLVIIAFIVIYLRTFERDEKGGGQA